MEDIPEGVVGLLTRSSTDVLSHVAIRARSQGVLLATCLGESGCKKSVAGGGCTGDLMVDKSCTVAHLNPL
jgi:alpha-glucan,water dikinase